MEVPGVPRMFNGILIVQDVAVAPRPPVLVGFTMCNDPPLLGHPHAFEHDSNTIIDASQNTSKHHCFMRNTSLEAP